MPDLIAHIRRHTTLAPNDAADAAQAVAEWLDRRSRTARLLPAIVLRSAARVIQAEVDREETAPRRQDARYVGPCMNASPRLFDAPPLLCELRAGHTGGHENGPTRWTESDR